MQGKQLLHKPVKNFVDLWHSIFDKFILYLEHQEQLVERIPNISLRLIHNPFSETK